MDFIPPKTAKQFFEQQKLVRDSLFPTCTIVNGKIYAFTSFKRLPIMIDMHSGEFTLLDNLKNYDPLFFADCMLSVGDNIYVLESNGNRLLKFHIDKKVCKYFDIGCHGKDWDNYVAFVQYEGYLYIIPRYINELVKVDIKSGQVKRDKKLHLDRNVYEINIEQKDFDYFRYGFQYRNVLCLFQRQSNLVLTYDMEQGVWKEYKLSIEINDCVHAVQYNEKIYILSSEGRIYQWGMTDESVKLIVDCSGKSIKNNVFARIAITEKRLFLLPAFGESIFWIDLDTKQVEKYSSYPSDFHYCGQREWCKYYGYCEDDNFYYFAMRSMNFILSLNKRNGREQWIKPQLPSYEMYKKTYLIYNRQLLNEKECSINGLVKYLGTEAIDYRHKYSCLVADQIWNGIKDI